MPALVTYPVEQSLMKPKLVVRAATVDDVDRVAAAGIVGGACSAKRIADWISLVPAGVQIIEDCVTSECHGYMLVKFWEFKRTRDPEDFCSIDAGGICHDPSGTEIHIAEIAIGAKASGTFEPHVLITHAISNLRHLNPKLRSVVVAIDQRCRSTREFFAKRRFVAVDQLPSFYVYGPRRGSPAVVLRKYFGSAHCVHESLVEVRDRFAGSLAIPVSRNSLPWAPLAG